MTALSGTAGREMATALAAPSHGTEGYRAAPAKVTRPQRSGPKMAGMA